MATLARAAASGCCRAAPTFSASVQLSREPLAIQLEQLLRAGVATAGKGVTAAEGSTSSAKGRAPHVRARARAVCRGGRGEGEGASRAWEEQGDGVMGRPQPSNNGAIGRLCMAHVILRPTAPVALPRVHAAAADDRGDHEQHQLDEQRLYRRNADGAVGVQRDRSIKWASKRPNELRGRFSCRRSG